jgi:hypothetical protein
MSKFSTIEKNIETKIHPNSINNKMNKSNFDLNIDDMDDTQQLKYYIFKYCKDPIDTINLIFGLDELYQFYHTNEKFNHYYNRCKELLNNLNDNNTFYLVNCLTIIKNMEEIDLLILKDTYSDLDSDSDYYSDCNSDISIDDFDMNELNKNFIEHECKEIIYDLVNKVIEIYE